MGAALVSGSCAGLKASLDTNGLKDIEKTIREDLKETTQVSDLNAFLADYSIPTNPIAAPEAFYREKMTRWEFSPKDSGGPVSGERLSLPSGAYFYFFRPRSWSGEKAVVFAPGFGVSDFAFRFIKKFFQDQLIRDYAILVWVPPFHLERLGPSGVAGRGLITEDPRDLLRHVASSVGEVAAGLGWLEAQGVRRIGAWGGSFGASILLLLGTEYRFDHISMMIPLIDWRELWKSEALTDLRHAFVGAGYAETDLLSAFERISPLDKLPRTAPNRIQILFAELDQLSPASTVLEYADRLYGTLAIENRPLYGFGESHTTILLNPKVYRRYADFLEAME
jgi:hypothetical protein